MGLTLSALLIATATLAAQPGPGPRMGMGPAPRGGANSAELFLAHTGDLKLTDAQVTRLAAIARRTDDRRRALRASLDSLAPARGPGARPDSATRARLRDRMRGTMEREREASRVDLRDALAVLTPDQLTTAWELRGARGDRAMRMREAGRDREMRERRQMRGPAGRQGPPE